MRERKFDLVASRLVVDVVGQARLLAKRIEDHKIHGILSHSPPCSDTQGSTLKVVNHCVVSASGATTRLRNTFTHQLFVEGGFRLPPSFRHDQMALDHQTEA